MKYHYTCFPHKLQNMSPTYSFISSPSVLTFFYYDNLLRMYAIQNFSHSAMDHTKKNHEKNPFVLLAYIFSGKAISKVYILLCY